MNRRRVIEVGGAGLVSVTAGCLSTLELGSSTGSIGERDPTPLAGGTETWPGDGFDAANTGANPDVALLGEDLEATRVTDDGAGIATGQGGTVAVAGDRLYVGTRAGDVVCRTVDGTQRWTYAADPHAGVRSVPSLTREVVYVSSDNGTYALDAADGEELWTSDAWIRTGSSVVTDGRLYAVAPGPAVVALDVETGERAWEADPLASHGLAVAGGRVYTTGNDSDGGVVSAIEAGERDWTRTDLAQIHAPPVVADDLVLVCTRRGRLLALDAADGGTVWGFHRGTGPSTRPAVAHDRVYLPAGNGSLTRCLDLDDGEARWHVRSGLVTSQPTAVADGVYVGTPNEGLFAVDPDGTVRWHDDHWRVDAPVVAVGDRLYVVPAAGPFGSGDLYALAT